MDRPVFVVLFVGPERGPGSLAATAEVELHCDYQLKYDYAMQALTAVSGYLTDDGQRVALVEKIRFAPRRK